MLTLLQFLSIYFRLGLDEPACSATFVLQCDPSGYADAASACRLQGWIQDFKIEGTQDVQRT